MINFSEINLTIPAEVQFEDAEISYHDSIRNETALISKIQNI